MIECEKDKAVNNPFVDVTSVVNTVYGTALCAMVWGPIR
jgi:hypothetical protein